MTSSRFLRMKDIIALCGVQRAAIHRRILNGTFPPPKKVGRAVFWLESDIEAWLEGLPRATYRGESK